MWFYASHLFLSTHGSFSWMRTRIPGSVRTGVLLLVLLAGPFLPLWGVGATPSVLSTGELGSFEYGEVALISAFSFENGYLQSQTGQLGLAIGYKTISMYAEKYGYEFLPVLFKPCAVTSLTCHCSWNRLFLTLQQFRQAGDPPGVLKCRRKWVMWLEGDTWITNSTIKVGCF